MLRERSNMIILHGPWPEPLATPLGGIRMQNKSQHFSSNFSDWPLLAEWTEKFPLTCLKIFWEWLSEGRSKRFWSKTSKTLSVCSHFFQNRTFAHSKVLNTSNTFRLWTNSYALSHGPHGPYIFFALLLYLFLFTLIQTCFFSAVNLCNKLQDTL